MPALIIFDIDGTLLETERVTVPAVQRTFAAHGLPVPDHDTICGFFGKPVETYEAWLAEQCPFGMAPQIVAETNALELHLIGSEGRLYEGVRGVLEELHAEFTLAVCSNGPDDYVNTFLDTHDVRRYLAAARARGTRYGGKIEMVAEIKDLGLGQPIIVVGDRHDDIEAAHANGALAVGAAYGFGGDLELAGADARIMEIRELPCLIKQLLA
jgi:phosphoglycolate phosphatase-like HAD superfamily hydrolase